MFRDTVVSLDTAIEENQLRALARKCSLVIIKNQRSGLWHIANWLSVQMEQRGLTTREALSYLRIYLGEGE